MPLSPAQRADIKACKGILSLAQAANRFGVSRRTVGRIYHDSEHSTAKVNSSRVIAKLQQDLEQLAATVEQLQRELQAHRNIQLPRRKPDPAYHGQAYRISGRDYSSPYRDSPGLSVVSVHGYEIPEVSRYDVAKIASDEFFCASHPVSPECRKYPYVLAAWVVDAKSGIGQGNIGIELKDPLPGKVCDCDRCQDWRFTLAYEDTLRREYPVAVAKCHVFRGHR